MADIFNALLAINTKVDDKFSEGLTIDETDIVKYVEVSATNTTFYNLYQTSVILIVKNTSDSDVSLTLDPFGLVVHTLAADGKGIYLRKVYNQLEQVYPTGSPGPLDIRPSSSIYMVGVPIMVGIEATDDVNLITDSRFTSACVVGIKNSGSTSLDVYTTDISQYDSDGTIYMNSDAPPYVTIAAGKVRLFIRILYNPVAFEPSDSDFTPVL